MRRSGYVRPTAGALLLVTAIYAVTAACSYDPLDPCQSGPEQILQRRQLDGIWAATTIDGASASGFQLPNVNPLATPVFFVAGSIDFKTRETRGPCDRLEKSAGYAVANYLLRKDGTVQPAKRYVGTFLYNHKTNVITLSAAGHQVRGTVSGGSTMTLNAPHPIFGTYVLVLVR